MTPRWVAPAAAFAILSTIACKESAKTNAPASTATTAPTADAGAVIARYAGKTLSTADAQEAMKRLPGPSRVYLTSLDRKRQFVDNLIMNDLMFEEGKRQGLDADPEITRQVDDF